MRIYTLGVYGFDEESFTRTLERARPGVFVDTRRRRAVRGSRYAFANSNRLQELLHAHGIPYVHRLDLAPSETTRRGQDAADRAEKIRRSDRDHLTAGFIAAYTRECLDPLDTAAFLHDLGPDLHSILIFCVEGSPLACHRSLLADRLARDLGAEVEHLLPPQGTRDANGGAH